MRTQIIKKINNQSNKMAKSRFTTADVKAMVRDVRSSLLGQRVANNYDLNDKTYFICLSLPFLV